MGLFTFIKNAGKKIFGGKEDDISPEALAEKKQAILDYVSGMNMNIKDFDASINAEGVVTLKGAVDNMTDYEKVGLMAGNISGVSDVNNEMTFAAGEEIGETKYHTVESGDTLWAIATSHYGDGNKYPVIVDANQPMIKDADEIYPGQVLRIPAQA